MQPHTSLLTVSMLPWLSHNSFQKAPIIHFFVLTIYPMTIFLQFIDGRVTKTNIPSVRFTPELRKKASSYSICGGSYEIFSFSFNPCMRQLRILTVVSAQDSAKVIILSPRIGAVLDRQGRDYFQILMRVNDFESAVFYQSADKRCFAKISLRPKFRAAERYDHLLPGWFLT